jgi:hypothetical protein
MNASLSTTGLVRETARVHLDTQDNAIKTISLTKAEAQSVELHEVRDLWVFGRTWKPVRGVRNRERERERERERRSQKHLISGTLFHPNPEKRSSTARGVSNLSFFTHTHTHTRQTVSTAHHLTKRDGAPCCDHNVRLVICAKTQTHNHQKTSPNKEDRQLLSHLWPKPHGRMRWRPSSARSLWDCGPGSRPRSETARFPSMMMMMTPREQPRLAWLAVPPVGMTRFQTPARPAPRGSPEAGEVHK